MLWFYRGYVLETFLTLHSYSLILLLLLSFMVTMRLQDVTLHFIFQY